MINLGLINRINLLILLLFSPINPIFYFLYTIYCSRTRSYLYIPNNLLVCSLLCFILQINSCRLTHLKLAGNLRWHMAAAPAPETFPLAVSPTSSSELPISANELQAWISIRLKSGCSFWVNSLHKLEFLVHLSYSFRNSKLYTWL